MQFSWNSKVVADQVVELSMMGQINEHSPLEQIVHAIKQLPGTKIRIDLTEVENINSSGVGRWLEMIDSFQKHRFDVEFIHCPINIVQQMNMVPQFRGHFHVRSAFTPYYCSNCDKEYIVEIAIPKGAQSKSVPIKESLSCQICGGVMFFDDIPDSFLSFLDH
jgi:anti-anti-sigma regulatory factor/DNA-directed RNA polymerase subunit RPC12/RpoP